ncbi:MAG: ferritin-like domain-containing protein [Bacteroidota bacterium]
MNLNKLMRLFDFNEAGGSNTRRDFFRNAGDLGIKASLAAIPAVILTALPKMVKAQSSTAIADVLNFALTLEYLEDEFYRTALDKSGLIPATDRNIFMQISKHETAHVAFLKSALGSSAVAKPDFDFTANGMFPTVFSDYNTFPCRLSIIRGYRRQGIQRSGGKSCK